MNPATGTGCTSVDIGGDANLELVDKFCYIRQVNVVNGGYTVMLAVLLSFCPSVRTQYLDANISKTV